MEVFRSRVSILEPHAGTLDALWTGGRRSGAELWRRLRTQGFQGSLRVVSEWATRRRLDESSNPVGRVRKTPSARKIARLLTIERDQIPKDHASIMAKIERDVPPLLVARDLVDRFHEIMRQQKALGAFLLDEFYQATMTRAIRAPFDEDSMEAIRAEHFDQLKQEALVDLRYFSADAPLDVEILAELGLQALFRRPDFFLSETGIVIAGYGTHQFFPSYKEYSCLGFLATRLFLRRRVS